MRVRATYVAFLLRSCTPGWFWVRYCPQYVGTNFDSCEMFYFMVVLLSKSRDSLPCLYIGI